MTGTCVQDLPGSIQILSAVREDALMSCTPRSAGIFRMRSTHSAVRLVGRLDVVHLPIGVEVRDRYLHAGLARLVPYFACRPLGRLDIVLHHCCYRQGRCAPPEFFDILR